MFAQTCSNLLLQCFTSLGIVTAIFQSIGFIRWIFTMPYLTEAYFTQPESRQTITLLYEMLNRFAGMGIGEHLGFIAMGSWTIILGVILLKSNQSKKWTGYAGCIVGFLLIISVAEHFGGQRAKLFGLMNFVANTVWILWLLVLAIAAGFTKQE